MQSAQSILTLAIEFIWYSFATLFIFDFLIGLPPLMQEVQLKMQQAEVQSLESISKELAEVTAISESNSDEATLQYLEMTGCDIEDFESVKQARQFLNENAPWTIEAAPTQSQISPNTARADRQPIAEPDTKLSFEQVRVEFAQIGWVFEKYRTGHYRYRVKVNDLYQRFKTLSDALDWLEVSKKLIQVGAK